MTEDETFEWLTAKQSVAKRSKELREATVRRDNLKTIVLTNLNRVKDDCDNWQDWDTTDRTNFESMSTFIEYAINFIEKE